MTEAKFITKARLRAKLTQVELAEALGYDGGQFISNAERGICALPCAQVRDFCRLTKASVIAYTRIKISDASKAIRRSIFHEDKLK